MSKAICLIRTSTDRQRIEEQRAEVLQMAHADGYTDNDIEVIGKCGASAIKLDDAYMENLNELYRRIESGDVAVVYAWAIDRIGRDEVVLMQLKNTLIRHKIQLVIKNPSLTLLNSDGTVNSGVEIAFSLFSTMAKQEMEQKKQRFHRGKKQNAENGKFNGGTVPFGYTLDERGFYILHSTEADAVKLAFELMASNKYTVATLTQELRARGVMYNGRLITYQFVAAMLKNTAYKGMRNKYAFNKVYPRIVSDELFEAAQNVKASNNSTKAKAKKHYNLAALLIKCPDCGRSYISHAQKYVCSGYNSPSIRTIMGQEKCNNNIIVRQKHLDGALWAIARQLHAEYMKGLGVEQKAEIAEQIQLLTDKIKQSSFRTEEIDQKFERIDDVYISGRMSRERYDKAIAAVNEERNQLKNEITRYIEEQRRLERLYFTAGKETEIEIREDADEKTMYDIVHKYVTNITLHRDTLNGHKAVRIEIECINNITFTLYYTPNIRTSDRKLFTVEGDKTTPFDYTPIIK